MKKVKIFAYLRDFLGSEVELDFPNPLTKEKVIQRFQAKFPALKEEFLLCEVAVNQEFLGENQSYLLEDVTEIALIPPVSGG